MGIAAQFATRLRDRLGDELDLLGLRHQGDEDAGRAGRRRAEDGADLVLEQLLERRRVEHASPVVGMAGAGGERPRRGDLVLAEVERPDAGRTAPQPLEELAVDADLLFLGRQRATGEEKELGPVEPDTLGLLLDHAIDLVEQVDVGLDPG
jgi:hypothetical protein